MSWHYANPLGSTKDQVRYLVGDTDPDDPLTSDEEIIWQLSENPDVRLAAVAVARQIATVFARYATVRTQDTQVDWNARATQYRLIAQDLERQSSERSAIPYAGGISRSDKETVEADTDRVAPAFTKHLHDYPGWLHDQHTWQEDDTL
jgi:hypothetical protein